MKMALKVFYVTILIFIGFNVYTNAVYERNEKFFNEEALKNIENNDHDNFVNNTLYFLGADKYLKQPIYNLQSADENFKFDINIYHYQKQENKKNVYGIAFYIFNIETSLNFSNLDLIITSPVSNKNIESRVNFINNNKFYNGNIIESLILDKEFVINEGQNQKSVEKIISIQLFDKNKLLATIDHNPEFSFKNENISNFESENNKLINNSFNGDIETFNRLKDKYENENNYYLVKKDTIKNYNSIITKNMINYIVVALLATFLVFFLEPLVNKIKQIKHKPENKQKND